MKNDDQTLDASWNELHKQLEQRKSDTLAESLKPLFLRSPTNSVGEKFSTFLLTSSCDDGVCRNGGRRGAAYGPKAILAQLRGMQKGDFPGSVFIEEVWPKSKKSFEEKQAQALTKIQDVFSKHLLGDWKNVLHLGGGNDHAYPFARALEVYAKKAGLKKIIILNIDAHADTRLDKHAHSGTPFRQLSRELTLPFELHQIGLMPQANSSSTLSSLSKGKMHLWEYLTLEAEFARGREHFQSYLKKILPKEEDALTFLSIDCDVFDSSYMEGVSALNPLGLSKEIWGEIWQYYSQILAPQKRFLGLYEYNPLYDGISAKGAKFLSFLLWRAIVS